MKALLFSLALSTNASAQALIQTQAMPTTATVSAPLEVQRLAPQLVAFVGGALITPSGTTQVNGVITTTAAPSTQQVSPAVAIQNTFSQAAAGGSTSLRNQTSDSRLPRGIADTPPTVMAPQTPTPIATPPSTASVRTR